MLTRSHHCAEYLGITPPKCLGIIITTPSLTVISTPLPSLQHSESHFLARLRHEQRADHPAVMPEMREELVRTIPGFWRLPELLSFHCAPRRQAETVEGMTHAIGRPSSLPDSTTSSLRLTKERFAGVHVEML
jgi:hypothetical protein